MCPPPCPVLSFNERRGNPRRYKGDFELSDTPQRDEPEDNDTGPQGTRVFRREQIEQHIAERDSRAGASTTATSGAMLMGVNGAFKGKRLDLPSGRSTLGRDSTNNIVVNDDSVSLVHARLVEKDGEWRVLNLLSTNGTWVNNKKVSDWALRDGDTVCFGQAEFVFHSATRRSAEGFWSRVRRWLGGR